MGTVSKNRGMSCVGVRKTGTTLIRVSTVMGTLYILLIIGSQKSGVLNFFDCVVLVSLLWHSMEDDERYFWSTVYVYPGHS